MKKNILLAFLFIAGISNAQLAVSKIDGTPIADGEIITFNSVLLNEATLSLKITNTLTSSIDVKLKCTGFINTDGVGMAVCFGGDCYSGVAVGQMYPSASTNVTIAAGENDTTSHFINSDPGNGTSIIDYVFQIYRTNNFGAIVGTPFSFTYRYNPSLTISTFDIKNIGLGLKSSVVSSCLEFDVTNSVNVQMYDMKGALIIEDKLLKGYQTVDVSNLSTGIYILKCSNNDGKKATIKIVKK
jgi:hypothetical protein